VNLLLWLLLIVAIGVVLFTFLQPVARGLRLLGS